jgi:hypothetical protein
MKANDYQWCEGNAKIIGPRFPDFHRIESQTRIERIDAGSHALALFGRDGHVEVS